MIYFLKNGRFKSVLLLLIIVNTSCVNFKTAIYDQYSFQKTVELKIDALQLMESATTPYKDNEKAISHFLKEVDKIIEYEKYKPRNKISYAMWKLIKNPKSNLLGGFFECWKTQNQLSKAFIKEAKLQISEALDMLLHYEGKKSRTAKANILNILSNNQ